MFSKALLVNLATDDRGKIASWWRSHPDLLHRCTNHSHYPLPTRGERHGLATTRHRLPLLISVVPPCSYAYPLLHGKSRRRQPPERQNRATTQPCLMDVRLRRHRRETRSAVASAPLRHERQMTFRLAWPPAPIANHGPHPLPALNARMQRHKDPDTPGS